VSKFLEKVATAAMVSGELATRLTNAKQAVKQAADASPKGPDAELCKTAAETLYKAGHIKEDQRDFVATQLQHKSDAAVVLLAQLAVAKQATDMTSAVKETPRTSAGYGPPDYSKTDAGRRFAERTLGRTQ
jgi:thioredoxin-like negative regulator of GroEL